MHAFNSNLLFLLFLLFYYFLDLLNPNLDLLFLKNAISLPFGQSLAEEIIFFFPSLASLAQCLYSVYIKKHYAEQPAHKVLNFIGFNLNTLKLRCLILAFPFHFNMITIMDDVMFFKDIHYFSF